MLERTPISHTALKAGLTTTEVVAAIGALTALWDNDDTRAEEAALDAHTAGRAAYWSRTTYHNQAGVALRLAANQVGLEQALADIVDESRWDSSAAYLLGQLVPLNRTAKAELERAWCHLLGEEGRDDHLRAFRDIVVAGEEAGWDVDANASVLNRARAAYAAMAGRP